MIAIRFRRIYRRITTLWFQLKYSGLIDCEHTAIIEERVKIKLLRTTMGGRHLLIRLKDHALIKNDVVIQGAGLLELGKHSCICAFSVIGVNERIVIGDNVLIGDHFSARDAKHNYDNVNIPISDQGFSTQPIIIEDDVWIGHGVTVLCGVKIGKGSIIAAGSVVNKNIPSYSIAGGVPARVIRSRIENT